MTCEQIAEATEYTSVEKHQQGEGELSLAQRALEQRTAELKQSLAMMRATLDSTADGILVVNAAGAVLDFNEQFLKVWGFPRDFVVDDHRTQLLNLAEGQLKNGDQFREATKEIYRSAPSESLDLLEFTDGRVFERSSKVQRIEDRIVGRVWCYREITKRVLAEEALRDEARMLELLNTTGAAIAAQLDLQNVVQIVTDAATELTGARFGAFFYTRKDENGEDFLLYTLSGAPREAFEKFGHPRATPLFGPTFRGEGPIRSDDILQDARYGQWDPHRGMPAGHLPVRSYLAMPVVLRSGEVIGGLFFGHPDVGVFTERAERMIVGVAAQAAIAIANARLYEAAQHELAERKRAEAERERLLVSEKEARERAERETRMKDEFLATLSHELRTPLNAILGWANILHASDRPEDVAEGVAVIERNARAQAQIIEDLLDMSRIVSGQVRLEIQPLDLIALINAAIESVTPMAAAKQITIETELDAAAARIVGDAPRIQQVFWNLLTNALKFTPAGGRVRVVLEHAGTHLLMRVIDSGQGITPEFLPSVFDRFRQADASTTRKHGGLGLGLAIVRNLVELHGGSVRADSEGTGRGATFTVSLPMSPNIPDRGEISDQPRDERATKRAAECPDLRGVRILAVDDEADARDLIRRLLGNCGATVELASSTADALHAFEKRAPDLLVSDIGMPVEDGYSLIRRVRELSPGKGGAVPAIALTAFARAEDRQRAFAAGFQAHLAKPVERAELLSAVGSLTGREGTTLRQPEFNY